MTAGISFIIFALAIKKGEKNITTSDKLNLLGAAVALALWVFTSDPLLSIILITIVDFLGFLPTIRKSYHKPHEETLVHYVLAGLKLGLAIVALKITAWLPGCTRRRYLRAICSLPYFLLPGGAS